MIILKGMRMSGPWGALIMPLSPGPHSAVEQRKEENMENLNDYERGLLEGVIDADGCINICKVSREGGKGWYPSIRISISNNHKKFLERIKGIIYQKTGYKTKIITKRKKGYKNNYEYRISSTEIMSWLLLQLDLVVKRRKQLKAIEILKIAKSGRGINRFNNKVYNKKLEKAFKKSK